MDNLLMLLLCWVGLSIPVALFVAGMFRVGRGDWACDEDAQSVEIIR